MTFVQFRALSGQPLRRGDQSGVIWGGNPSPASSKHYPLDGRMLAAASRLFVKHNKGGAIFPAPTLFNCVVLCWSCHYSVHEGGNYRRGSVDTEPKDYEYFNG